MPLYRVPRECSRTPPDHADGGRSPHARLKPTFECELPGAIVFQEDSQQ